MTLKSSVLSAGIDTALGLGSSSLIYKTMELAYDLKVTPISVRTRKFDGALARLIGKNGYDHVIQSIISEVRENHGTGR